ncbi:hypothetical protein ANO11243_000010 [Dothideomycetidae sp. 11243]|nr:hypothetical protein ANO11243_000010 [fungal sp. No.11243]
MVSPEADLAFQFDRATVGMSIAIMRDQIIANAESMFWSHYSGGMATYSVTLAEHSIATAPLLQFAAAAVRSDANGVRIALQGPREATVWAAYRSLLRITMKELGKRSDFRIRARESAGGSSFGKDSSKDTPRKSKSMRLLGLEDRR